MRRSRINCRPSLPAIAETILQRGGRSGLAAMIALALLAGNLTGCADAVTESKPRSGGSTVVQGGQCFARTRDGRLVRVSPSRCPELKQQSQERREDPALSAEKAEPSE